MKPQICDNLALESHLSQFFFYEKERFWLIFVQFISIICTKILSLNSNIVFCNFVCVKWKEKIWLFQRKKQKYSETTIDCVIQVRLCHIGLVD